VLQKSKLRKILGAKNAEITGDWRVLRIKELYILYSSPNILRVITSTRMR
jgi:hypothetical protein